MNARSLRRWLPALLAVLAAGLVVGVMSASSSSTVTRARLERNLPLTFSRLYVQQAKILGHKGITVQSLHARAQCDKGGPKVADVGPGADWICLMTWNDPNLDPSVMPGKFELNVHSNDCYTAGGPSKIVGLITITDTHGNDVPNPVFEFDSCFDPSGTDKPTGVTIPTTTSSTTTSPAPAPAALTLQTAPVTPSAGGRVAVHASCSVGDGGCAGTVSATIGGRSAGSRTFAIAAGKSATLPFQLPAARGRGSRKLHLALRMVIGTSSTATATIPVAG